MRVAEHGVTRVSAHHPVLVIGGTRSTGLHAAHVLQRKGIPVRVLARNPFAAAERVGPRIEIVPGDVTRKDTLYPAFHDVSHLIFTAGVRSGRFARQAVVKATEYGGILNAIEAARAQDFHGRFVYMTSIGITRSSLFASMLNIWKGNTLLWRRRAEDAIRSSGFDYTIVRAAFLLNRPANQRAIRISQNNSALTLHEGIARADVAEALVEAVYHPDATRATFEIRWARGPRQSSWPELLSGLQPDRQSAG
ncbi:MAG: NAD(P)H-binding protein [Longimicrobiales bacterium]